MKKRTRRIDIPQGITSEEFFVRFVPETFRKNVTDYDMSPYHGINLDIQFNISGSSGGDYGLKMINCTEVETSQGTIPDPILTYTFTSKAFGDAVDGKLPWFPLDIVFDPEALKDEFSPDQAHEEMDILEGIFGQADIRVTGETGEVAELRMNFHGQTEPAVTFNTNHTIVKEIQDEKYTVMEGFMAGKIKVDGPVEFAMHVMALAPEDDD